jgi:hypothetical protein
MPRASSLTRSIPQLVYYLVLRDQGPGDRVFRSLQNERESWLAMTDDGLVAQLARAHD